MARKQEKKPVEWKETNLYEYTPKYDYSIAVRNRFLPIWGLAKSFKKLINMAYTLAKPNKICCVYMLGDVSSEKLTEYVRKKDGECNGGANVCVFTTVEPSQTVVDACEKEVTDLADIKGKGYTRSEKNIAELRQMLKQNQFIVDNPDKYTEEEIDVCQAFLRDYIPILKVLESKDEIFDRFPEVWNKGFRSTGCWNGYIDSTVEAHDAALIEIAKAVYPYGIEAFGPQRKGYGVTSRDKYAISGCSGKKELGFELDDLNAECKEEVLMYSASCERERLHDYKPIDVYPGKVEASKQTGIKEDEIWRSYTGRVDSVKWNNTRVFFVRKIAAESVPLQYCQDLYEFVNRKLLDSGMCNWREVNETFRKPPYGYYPCNYYGYLTGIAMRRYVNGKFYGHIGVWSDTLTPEDIGCLVHFCTAGYEDDGTTRKYGLYVVYKQSTRQRDFVRLLRKLFQIKSKDDNYQKIRTKLRSWCSEHYRLSGIANVDDVLYKLINGGTNVIKPRDHVNDVYDDALYFGYEENFQYVKDNFDELQKRILNEESRFYDELVTKYGRYGAEKYKNFWSGNNRHAKGWLWDKELIDREVDTIVNKYFRCRECDKPIYNEDFSDIHKHSQTEKDGYTWQVATRIGIKDLMAVQKKLFGREINQYFCLDCLLEELDISADELFEMIERFKEEGCKLFG